MEIAVNVNADWVWHELGDLFFTFYYYFIKFYQVAQNDRKSSKIRENFQKHFKKLII